MGRPVLRRLAVRQLSRRPAEAFIVIAGSLLGTTLIVASLVVGDSLDRSVRQTAYDVFGPFDETVRISSSAVAGIGQSGLDVPGPGPHAVVINDILADSLGVAAGDHITFHLYGKPHVFTVSSIVPASGVAGSGIGAAVNRDAIFTPGVLTAAATGSDARPSTVVFVPTGAASNQVPISRPR